MFLKVQRVPSTRTRLGGEMKKLLAIAFVSGPSSVCRGDITYALRIRQGSRPQGIYNQVGKMSYLSLKGIGEVRVREEKDQCTLHWHYLRRLL